MKKSMSIIAAITLATAMVSSLPTFATDITQESDSNSATTNLTYKVDKTYKVTIPDDVTNLTSESKLTVEVADVVIDTGETLSVNIASTNGWTLNDTKDADNALAYELALGETLEDGANALADDDVVLSVAAGTATGSQIISVKSIAAATKSGTYTDTLTFTVDVTETPAE